MNLIKRTLIHTVIGLSAVIGCTGNAFAEGVADKVSVTDPYIRAVPPVVKTTAAFMQLQSSDAAEQFVVSAASPIAGTVELHTHTMDDGVMRMRQVPHIHLPPNETVELKPGGLHVMLFDLQGPLNVGDKIPVTLNFKDGSSKTVEAEVRSIKAMMEH